MSYDIRKVRDITDLIGYFSENLNWAIDIDDFDDIEDISYDFEAEDIGLKEENFAKIKSLRQLQPLVDGQQWGIFCIEFDSKKFEVSALRKILSKFVPKRRSMVDHAVWKQQDLLFICNWGADNNRTIGIAHFEDKENGLPQIKMISCAPALEEFDQISMFEERLSKLKWPSDVTNTDEWRQSWSSAFVLNYLQTIHDSETLTEKLANEARQIKERIINILEVETERGSVHQLYEKFRDNLIYEMHEEQFADMYAQTVVYGLFSARCMDPTQEDFSAEEAIECIPNTNPFLKSLLKECFAGNGNSTISFDELEVGNIVELLLHTKTELIIQDFNRQTGGGKEDPVIYFYEGFLNAYEKEQKKRSGVYYTPASVVNFMVRSVHYLLKNEFGIEKGMASTETKTITAEKIKKNGQKAQKGRKIEVPCVQILDPATGTGTFLRQVILQIYHTFRTEGKFVSMDDFYNQWNDYVDNNLLPRIFGYEIMMAPYAVAHMKLAMLLQKTGYRFQGTNRLKVFLTNSLEKPGNSEAQMSLFYDPLANESVAANEVKKSNCINVCIGNPPYNAASLNVNDWITELMAEYKMEPGGIQKLNERNPKWINDDYVKFIKLCEDYITREGEGILAFINPHGFIDNPTFRGMRWSLLRKFDTIYVLDLHGNSNRKEKSPNGSKDENVFDIQQGVSINFFIKSKKRNKFMADVYHADLWGVRSEKYNFLLNNSLSTVKFEKVEYQAPLYLFRKQDMDLKAIYDTGFSVTDLFEINGVGITTAHDEFVISEDKEALLEKFTKFKKCNPNNSDLYSEFDVKTKTGWDITEGWRNIQDTDNLEEYIQPISYRPFDNKYIFYEDKLVWRTVRKIMNHFVLGDNIGLVTARSNKSNDCTHFYISKYMMETKCGERTTQSAIFPLYIYSRYMGKLIRKTNLKKEIVEKIGICIGGKVCKEESDEFSPELILDYIYAVLYSNKYREKYKDFLKIDFPKVPYPKNYDQFRRLAAYGYRLRRIHLMEEALDLSSISYEGNGNNSIEAVKFADNRIYINKSQYFSGVSIGEWSTNIGGYNPLQKWMKDRKKTKMTTERIAHYCYMIAAMRETNNIMREIDEYFEVE